MSNDPIVNSSKLDARLEDDPIVTNLVRIANQHWAIIRWLIVAFAVMTGIVIAMIFLAVGSKDTARQAKEAAAAANSAVTQERQLCEAGNASRQDQRRLWNHLLAISVAHPVPNETPAQTRARLRLTVQFQAYISKTFAPRDCKHIKVRQGSSATLPMTQTGPSSPVTPAQADGQPQPVPAPAPPAPKHSTASPVMSSRPTPARSSVQPAPSSSPSAMCDLQQTLHHPFRCLRGRSAAVDPPASGGHSYPWIAVAVIAITVVASQLVRVSSWGFQGGVIRSGASAD